MRIFLTITLSLFQICSLIAQSQIEGNVHTQEEEQINSFTIKMKHYSVPK